MCIYLKPSEVPQVFRNASSGYTGRDYRVEATTKVHIYGCAWDEGNRNQYQAVRLLDGSTAPTAHEYGNPFDGSPISADFPLTPDVAVVCRHWGRVDYCTIYVHPDCLQKLLPAPDTLSEDEKIVLYYTRSRKSTYAGIKNYRLSEAKREKGITADRWESAKAACISRKLLNAAGAITTDGKNALTAAGVGLGGI